MGTGNPAAPAVSAAPAIDYADIAKGMKEVESAPAAQPPAQPSGEQSAQASVEAKPPEGEQQQPAEKVEEKPVEKEEKPGEKDALQVNFEKLVTAKKEFRQEIEAAKPGIELARVLGNTNAAALQRSLVSKDVMGVLSAIGISYTDVARAMAGQKPVEKPADKPGEPSKTETANPELASIREELAALKQEREQARAAQQQRAVEQKVKEVVQEHASKLKHLSALEAHGEVISVLNEMYQRAGGFPSNDPVENIRLAAEEAENRLAKQAERWKKVLTPGAGGASTEVAKATVTPSAPAQGGAKTLTNSMGGAPVVPQSDRFDVESVIKQLKDDPNLRK